MAATDSIRDHVQTLEDQLAQATNLAHCFAEATALTEAPPWVSLLIRQIHDLNRAASTVIEDVNLHCMPLLKDMQSVTRKG